MIKDLKDGEIVLDQIYYVTQKTEGTSTRGTTYWNVTLQDGSGTIGAKIWEVTSSIEAFEPKQFVRVAGRVQSYKDTLQIIINEIKVVDSSQLDVGQYSPTSKQDIEEMFAKLQCLIASIQDVYLKQLLESFFTDEGFVSRFKKSSGAKSMHHAFVGGLLEHSLAVANTCSFFAKQYPEINRDLLITAGILHDVGKVKEFSEFPENEYTDEGYLLGHIYMGTEMIETKAQQINGFPERTLLMLKHCILAHHGKKEFGSPVCPSILEAVALNLADDSDAKFRRMIDVATEEWSERTDFAFDSKIIKTVL